MQVSTLSEYKRARDHRPLLAVLALTVMALDRLSKVWIDHHVPVGHFIPVVPGVFRISHVLNTGAAFSLLADSVSSSTVRNILVAFSVFAAVVLVYMLWRTGRALTITSTALALILGGALGNLYDRVCFAHVIDFLEVTIVRYHWPDFNLADSAICIGAALLMLEILRPHPTEA